VLLPVLLPLLLLLLLLLGLLATAVLAAAGVWRLLVAIFQGGLAT
jgi:hypothetical protein